ncbi:MAG: alpha/beta hydrolase-fold protein [Bacteroidota bacterium]
MRLFTIILALISVLSCKENDPPRESGTPPVSRFIHLPSFNSSHVQPRNVTIFLPEEYDSSGNYKVLYMHDGQNLFDASTTWNNQEWGVDEAIDSLVEANSIEESIVIGIHNTNLRYAEYFPEKPFKSLDSVN